MRILLALIVFTVAASILHAAEIINKSWAPIKGAQLFVLSPEYNNDYDRFFAELAEKGVNTAYIRVFHNNIDRTHGSVPNPCPDGGVYFKSKTACTVDDILPDMIKAAHKHGISVYGWMATRSLSFLKTPDKMSMSFAPGGGVIPGYGTNILHPEVRSSLEALFTELAESGVDGILVQDDFIMKYTEGADLESCRKFSSDTGKLCAASAFYETVTASDGTLKFGKAKPDVQEWYRWKASVLQNFLKDLRAQVRLVNPKIKWAVNIYYETPIYPDQGLAWYSQDIHGIWAAGVDYLAVMAYHEQIMKEKNFTRSQFLDFMSDMSTAAMKSADKSERIIFKLQSRLFDTERTPVEAVELKLLCNRLEREQAKSFVQLPVFAPGDIIETCGFK